MTKSLARALAPEIRVNAISPGLIRAHFVGPPGFGFRLYRLHP
jgi:NAD(P)-dependent dehydrogenase (short-subunit alcohol dehydrogenase family)